MQNRRSRAREVALQLLVEYDLNPQPMPRRAVEAFAATRLLKDREASTFALQLFEGVKAAQADLDAKISATAENWKLHRMLPVDRNVLRLAAYEILVSQEPPAVAMNEAIELSRRYGSLDSPGFVNGILDRIAKTIPDAAA